MLNISSVEDYYQYSLREKEKLKRRHQGNSKGKEKKEHFVKDKHIVEDEPKPIKQKRRIDRGTFKGTCFKFLEARHRSFECSNVDRKDSDRRVIVVNEKEYSVNEPKVEDKLLVQRVLFGKKVLEPVKGGICSGLNANLEVNVGM